MDVSSPQTRTRIKTVTLGWVAASFLVLSLAEPAHAVPSLARKYQTSCITCHTVYPKLNDVGEAFRRNGYQFPSDEDVLVKEEPVKLGVDAYKDMFPNSIWPSTLPSIPPISIRSTMWNVVDTQPHGQQKTWDLNFPHEVGLLGAATMGKDITGWFQLTFAPGEGADVERCFVQFSNLFAWDPDEDKDGTHLGSRWAILPPHALNLRLGKMETSVLPHVASEHARLTAFEPLPTTMFSLGQTGFSLESTSPAVELHGVVKQYWSYAIGLANGGSASGFPVDDNTFKDVYFRVARKWFGYPLDGVVGQPEQAGKGAVQAKEPDESIYVTPGLDFWRAVGFETGVFGWWGKSNIPLTADLLPPDVVYDPNDPSTFRKEYFRRIGVDARLQYFDLDLYGVAFWGHDPFPGFLQDNITAAGPTDHLGYFIEADYTFKPWLLGFLRYEQVRIFNRGLADEEQARLVPGAVFLIRQNLKLTTELYIDTRGVDTPDPDKPESTAQWITSLDWAF